MKIFHSELTANPAYYSFGYAVYGLLEEGDSLDAAYADGFLPFVGAEDQPEKMMYMARGSRVRLSEYKELHDQTGALRKLEKLCLSPIDVTVWEKKDFKDAEGLISFLATYFTFRFGKGSMPEARLRALIASPLLTHISEYSLRGKVIGYVLETHTENLTHLWYEAYTKEYVGKHIGMYLFIDFVRRAKESGKEFAYMGATYGNWMRYKANFKGLEYWNGREWIKDMKKLKHLLAGDPERLLGFADEWRELQRPFYPSPYPFRNVFAELRFLTLFMVAQRRIFGALIILFAVVLGWTWLSLFVF